MAMYLMPSRSIPLDDSWDVVVVGGGSSGCAAAIAAAEEGARTLRVEAGSALGGMSTSGLVPVWVTYSDGEKIIYRGLAEKVFSACKAGMPHVDPRQPEWVPIDAERLKRIYDGFVTGAGATVSFNTLLAAVETGEDGAVRALILANKAGLNACRARVYVDCTGDADLAAWAGAPFEKGDANGDLQPATLCMMLSNVDTYGYEHCGRILDYGQADPVIRKMLASGKYPAVCDFHFDNSLVGPGTVTLNAGHMWKADNTDPGSSSRALIQGRQNAAQFRDALAEFFPRAFGNALLAATAAQLGARETRRIVGDYVLAIEDYKARRSFPDEICRSAYTVDVQNASPAAEDIRAAQQDYDTMAYRPGESYGVPYRCLTPRGVRNVLVAGRCISTDRLVNGSTRMIPVCLATGEAAGTAAAMAARGDADVHGVAVDLLRTRLRQRGVYLP